MQHCGFSKLLCFYSILLQHCDIYYAISFSKDAFKTRNVIHDIKDSSYEMSEIKFFSHILLKKTCFSLPNKAADYCFSGIFKPAIIADGKIATGK